MAGSLLRALRVPELITHNLEEYEAKAGELSLRPHALERLRERMAQNRSHAPLFDTQRFRHDLEAAYTEMWLRNERGLKPAGMSVPGSEDSARGISGPTNGA
jgi:protein O-GlcNAc transferase